MTKPRTPTLRQRVEIRTRVPISDGYGGEIASWETIAVRPCDIRHDTAFRYEVQSETAGAMISRPKSQIVMRRDTKTSEITPGMRLVDAATRETYAVETSPQPLDGSRSWVSLSVTLNKPS